MEERTVTVDGVPNEVPRPFMVIATQNPVEMDGTYPLPEAQLDRFLMKTSLGYPDLAAETRVLAAHHAGRRVAEPRIVATAAGLDLAAVLPRADCADVLVATNPGGLEFLPAGARVEIEVVAEA